MGRPTTVVAPHLVCMAAVIVGADVAFFRDQFWARQLVNAGVITAFAAFYLRVNGRPWSPWNGTGARQSRRQRPGVSDCITVSPRARREFRAGAAAQRQQQTSAPCSKPDGLSPAAATTVRDPKETFGRLEGSPHERHQPIPDLGLVFHVA